jgi:uncharacterized protein YjbI with pentapeptide repeats
MGDVVRDVALARTLAELRSLVGDQKGRNGQVIRFLYEAELIRGKHDENGDWNQARMDLDSADLSSVRLPGANLSSADLNGVHLIQADLTNANLNGVHLICATLIVACLMGADLQYADLRGANLQDAKNWTNQQLAQARSLDGAILTDGRMTSDEYWDEYQR